MITELKFNEPEYITNEKLAHLCKFNSWMELQQTFKHIQSLTPSLLFANRTILKAADDNKEAQPNYKKSIINAANIELNYNLQPITTKALEQLCKIAENINLSAHIERLFTGAAVNTGENRPALHTALRAFDNESIFVNNQNIVPDILSVRGQTLEIANKIRNNKWFTDTNKIVTDIVNIGIGGSALGPKMATYALQEFNDSAINLHFLADNDPKILAKILKNINLSSTIFIINSKSFTTPETIGNFHNILEKINHTLPLNEHVIAITNNVSLAKQYKIKHILPVHQWIGGRFSFCSAVNLILATMIGQDAFLDMLDGAKAMDNHFRRADFTKNLPVISALLDIWNFNFFKSRSHILLTYANFLQYLPDFLQQLSMESNGKSFDINNNLIQYSTSPIVWGGLGCHAEHSYYQFIIQGSQFNAIDYFFIDEPEYQEINFTALQKIELIAKGVGNPDYKKLRLGINILTLDKLSPSRLGALVAMYEHRVYCQSVLWNINAFDQPGVSAAKIILAAQEAT